MNLKNIGYHLYHDSVSFEQIDRCSFPVEDLGEIREGWREAFQADKLKALDKARRACRMWWAGLYSIDFLEKDLLECGFYLISGDAENIRVSLDSAKNICSIVFPRETIYDR